jgi:hypothetical protein
VVARSRGEVGNGEGHLIATELCVTPWEEILAVMIIGVPRLLKVEPMPDHLSSYQRLVEPLCIFLSGGTQAL